MTSKFKPGDLLHEPRASFVAERTPFLILELYYPLKGGKSATYIVLDGEKILHLNAHYVDKKCEKLE